MQKYQEYIKILGNYTQGEDEADDRDEEMDKESFDKNASCSN